MKITKSVIILFVAVFALMSFTPVKETKAETPTSTITLKNYKRALNFFVISDWG